MKKIALFSDGTSNSSANPHKTNVWRAYQALDRRPGSGQVAFYDNGVGTSQFTPTAILGLAFGWGLARNVRDIYGFLCRTYNQGDKIYGFGFSRGAFTMRVVMALIASEGIIDRNVAQDERDLDRLILAAYRRFRRDGFDPSILSFLLRPIRDGIVSVRQWIAGREPYDRTQNIGFAGDTENPPPIIEFIGVWDTVDAYGLPIDELTRAWDKVIWPLTAKDHDLSPRIKHARQALALDEQRESFEPMLWNETVGESANDRLMQIWFAGVHANVGGSYPDDSLALVSLNWMLTESEKSGGLSFLKDERDRYLQQANCNGPLNDSRNGIGNFYRYGPRQLERLYTQENPGLVNWFRSFSGRRTAATGKGAVPKPILHHSIFDRLQENGTYAPINIPEIYAVVDSDGGMHDIAPEGAAHKPVRENAETASTRRQAQSLVWNKVWLRKVLYLLTLCMAVLFIAYPYIAPDLNILPNGWIVGFLEPILGSFSFIIPAIPDLIVKIPLLSFAEDWATRYNEYPYEFTIGLIIISGLLVWSLRTNAALKSEMRGRWRHVTNTGNAPAAGGAIRKWWANLLDDQLDANGNLILSVGSRVIKGFRIVLETATVAVFIALVIAASSRLFFTVADGTGAICDTNPTIESRQFGKTFTFDPKNPCFDTGLKLVKRKHYLIEFQLENGWTDDGIEADLYGWRTASWRLYLATPWRRHLFVPWYQTVARVDDVLFDRHQLRREPRLPGTDEVPQTYVSMGLTARRSGRLYLYVNDAVVFAPGFIEEFYRNNKGHACVRVSEVTDDAGAAPTDGVAELPSSEAVASETAASEAGADNDVTPAGAPEAGNSGAGSGPERLYCDPPG